MRTSITRRLVLFLCLFLAACGPAESPETAEPEPARETQAPETDVAQTRIAVDGEPEDWEGRELTAEEPAGDAEGDFLDLTNGYAFANRNALYFMVELSNPSADVVQFDLDLSADGQPLFFSWRPGHEQPTNAPNSRMALGSVFEGRIDLADLGLPESSILLKQIRVMVGEEPPASTWRSADTMNWGYSPVARLNEVDAPMQTQGQSAEAEPTQEPSAPPPTRAPLTERPSAVWLEIQQEYAGFLYRQFLQNPQQAAWGPDGYLYIADGGGRHIVKVAPDGGMQELGIWRTNQLMAERGPQPLTIDSAGNLFFGVASTLFRYRPDGSLEEIFSSPEGEFLSFTMDPDDTLYYSLNSGSIYRWNPDGGDELIASDFNSPNIAISPDGTLYINVYREDRIMAMDLESRETRLFAEGMEPVEGCYLNVDIQGDLWARCIWQVYRYSPDGEPKPFIMDGMSMPDDRFNFHLGGGFDFDDQGNLWVTDGTGTIIRLNAMPGEGSEDVFASEYVYYSFEASDMDVAPDGTVYSDRLIPGEFWRFDPDGSADVILEESGHGRSAVAVNPEGRLFLSHDELGIVAYQDGEIFPYDGMHSRRMIFGADGNLYAVEGREGELKSIIRISGPGSREVFLTEIAGSPLGREEVHLARAGDDGLYVLTEENCNLYKVDFEGNGEFVQDIAPECRHAIMASSPVADMIYFLSHESTLDTFPMRYSLYQFEPGGELTLLSPQIPGDPWAMAVSPGGEWLYVAEVGAINKIPLIVP